MINKISLLPITFFILFNYFLSSEPTISATSVPVPVTVPVEEQLTGSEPTTIAPTIPPV